MAGPRLLPGALIDLWEAVQSIGRGANTCHHNSRTRRQWHVEKLCPMPIDTDAIFHISSAGNNERELDQGNNANSAIIFLIYLDQSGLSEWFHWPEWSRWSRWSRCSRWSRWSWWSALMIFIQKIHGLKIDMSHLWHMDRQGHIRKLRIAAKLVIPTTRATSGELGEWFGRGRQICVTNLTNTCNKFHKSLFKLWQLWHINVKISSWVSGWEKGQDNDGTWVW